MFTLSCDPSLSIVFLYQLVAVASCCNTLLLYPSLSSCCNIANPPNCCTLTSHWSFHFVPAEHCCTSPLAWLFHFFVATSMILHPSLSSCCNITNPPDCCTLLHDPSSNVALLCQLHFVAPLILYYCTPIQLLHPPYPDVAPSASFPKKNNQQCLWYHLFLFMYCMWR